MNTFQFHLRTFALSFQGHGFGTRQRGAEVAYAVQMHLPALAQFPPHKVGQCIEHGRDIRLRQRAVFLDMPPQLGSRSRAVQLNARMQGQLPALFLFSLWILVPIKQYCHNNQWFING